MPKKDLGTQSIEAVKAALESSQPSKRAVKLNEYSQKNKVELMSFEQRVAFSESERIRVNDLLSDVKLVGLFWLKIFIVKRMMLDPVIGNKRVSWAVIFGYLYYRWCAPQIDHLPPHVQRDVKPFLGYLLPVSLNKHRLHDFVLKLIQDANFQTFRIPIPMAGGVFLMDARDREYVLKINPLNFPKNRDNDMGSLEYA